MIVYQDPLHLEVCLLAVFLILKLNECILEAITGTLVSNDFARHYGSETVEDGVQILICWGGLVSQRSERARGSGI